MSLSQFSGSPSLWVIPLGVETSPRRTSKFPRSQIKKNEGEPLNWLSLWLCEFCDHSVGCTTDARLLTVAEHMAARGGGQPQNWDRPTRPPSRRVAGGGGRLDGAVTRRGGGERGGEARRHQRAP